MSISQPSIEAIVSQPYGFESLQNNIPQSILEAERLSRNLASDRISTYAFTQVMKYAIETLHPLGLNIIISHISDPEANQQLCYDAPLDRFRNPRAARLWAFLEILPIEYRLMVPDRIVEFWIRHPDSGIKEVGMQVARANRAGTSLKGEPKASTLPTTPPESLPPVPDLSGIFP